jgi:HEPN domain-containing protein
MKEHKPAVLMLRMAKKDLAALEGMLDDRIHFSDEIFGFHAEQSVEKALKAWISAAGVEYPFTHDISLLMNTLIKSGISMDEWTDLLELGSFGVQFRYEEMEISDEPVDRIAMLNRVKLLLNKVEDIITLEK